MLQIYQNIFLTVFYHVNKLLPFSLVGRLSLTIFIASKVMIIGYITSKFNESKDFALFYFILFFILDVLLIEFTTDIHKINVNEIYAELENKELYKKVLIIYLIITTICSYFYIKFLFAFLPCS